MAPGEGGQLRGGWGAEGSTVMLGSWVHPLDSASALLKRTFSTPTPPPDPSDIYHLTLFPSPSLSLPPRIPLPPTR